jgi:hypothetical protein
MKYDTEVNGYLIKEDDTDVSGFLEKEETFKLVNEVLMLRG